MKTITEMAEEYAVLGRASGTEAIRKRAYLAGARAMKALAVEAARGIPRCPFETKNNLQPTDPCPVCGDLGTFDQTKPSKCQSAMHAILAIPE